MTTTDEEVLYVYQAKVPIEKGEPSSSTANKATEEKEEKEECSYYLEKKGQRRRLRSYFNFDDGKFTLV